ncbi:MAG: hypothetical protein ACREUV_03205, partial [Burkholderiales bacterium]
DSEEWTDKELNPLFTKLDNWTMEVAELCISRDRQLDLSGALPHPIAIQKAIPVAAQAAAA